MPGDLLSCAQAFTTSTTFSFRDLKIGETAVRGDEAVVTVTGSFCADVNGKTTCSTNGNVSEGQPRGTTAGAFAAAYTPAHPGTLGHRSLPCQKIDGTWYVSLPG